MVSGLFLITCRSQLLQPLLGLCLQVLAQMQAAIITCLPQASPHAISMALTGYKSLPYRPRQLIQALNCLSQNDLLEFEPRHLSSALHALASMRLAPGEELFQSIITAAQLQQESFGPEEWANITWSLAWFAKHSRTLRYAFSDTLTHWYHLILEPPPNV